MDIGLNRNIHDLRSPHDLMSRFSELCLSGAWTKRLSIRINLWGILDGT